MNKERIKKNLASCESRDNEDTSIIELFEKLDHQKNYKLLEVGSGLCRFVKKIHKLFPNITISCVEINNNLAKIAENEGCKVYNTNFLENDIESDSFDIVHCSHVIEHFDYPKVRLVIDELLRITKTDGFLIIRSPLMWEHFYDDLDHVRPYPPQSIINYLYNPQQQTVGKNKINIVRTWYRTCPIECHPIDRSNWAYFFTPIRLFYNKYILPNFNNCLKSLWNKYRWPATKPNGYVLILTKKSNEI